jgi:hypothetical protein
MKRLVTLASDEGPLRPVALRRLLEVPDPRAAVAWRNLWESRPRVLADLAEDLDLTGFPGGRGLHPDLLLAPLRAALSSPLPAERRVALKIIASLLDWPFNTRRGFAHLDTTVAFVRLLDEHLPQQPDPAERAQALPLNVNDGAGGSAVGRRILERLYLRLMGADPHPWVRCRAAQALLCTEGGSPRAAVTSRLADEADPTAQRVLRALLAGERQGLEKWPPR